MKMCLALLIAYLSLASQAATYYIDFVDGVDSNNGTSTATPWKRHPYMATEAVSYSHTAGDIFIFKGGVTWPRSCFQLNITAGGSSASVHDVYTVSNGWYAGGSWARPVFDFEHNNIAGYEAGAGVRVNAISYVTFDNLELKRHRGELGAPGYGCVSLAIAQAAGNVKVLNCYIYDWDLPSNPTSGQDGGSGGGVHYIGAGGGGGLVVSNCAFHQGGVVMKTGTPIYLSGTVSFNTASNTATHYVGGGTIHNNHFHHSILPTDPAFHANAILIQYSASNIYSNLIHDLNAESEGIYCDNGFGSGTGTNLVHGNYVQHFKQAIIQDVHNGSVVGLRGFNNTLVTGSSACVRVGDSASSGLALSHLELRNNWFVTTSATIVTVDTSVTTTIANYNLTNSTATANSYGAVVGNFYQPTSVTSPTIDTGTNLLSYFTRSLPFDVGALEYAYPITPSSAIRNNVTLRNNVTVR